MTSNLGSYQLAARVSNAHLVIHSWDCRLNEQRTTSALAALTEPLDEKVLTTARTLELAQKAHSMYLAQDPAEQAKLLNLVLSNCQIDEVSVYPNYNIPFALIAQRAKTEDWLRREDSYAVACV